MDLWTTKLKTVRSNEAVKVLRTKEMHSREEVGSSHREVVVQPEVGTVLVEAVEHQAKGQETLRRDSRG